MDRENEQPGQERKEQAVPGPEQAAKQRTPVGRFFHNYGYLFVTVIVMVALFRGIFLLGFVTSGSMETTLPTHSVFLSWRLSYLLGDPTPQRGDIMLFHSDELDETLVKRVIGLPGDTITFQDGYVYRNGEKLEEDYVTRQGVTYSQSGGDVFTVPEGCVFLLGDHRDNSLDSRYWEEPYIPLSALRARALADVSLAPGSSWIGVRWVG